MIRIIKTLCALLIATPAFGDGEPAGDFDYYVLSLSWTPNWCALEGDDRAAPECREQGRGWSLHGLWPQYDYGWPSYCRTAERDPSRTMTGSMTDIMGSSGLAWYEWKKHGRCSGLSAQAYFDTSRAAFESIAMPEILRQIPREMSLPPSVVQAAFLEVNEGMVANGITITCRDGMIQEARICLSKELELRECGADVRNECSYEVDIFPIR